MVCWGFVGDDIAGKIVEFTGIYIVYLVLLPLPIYYTIDYDNLQVYCDRL